MFFTTEAISDDVDVDLFCKMANPRHCVYSPFVLLNRVSTTSDTKDYVNCP